MGDFSVQTNSYWVSNLVFCRSRNVEVGACKWIVLKVVVNLLLPQCKIWGWRGPLNAGFGGKTTLVKEMKGQGVGWSRSGVDRTPNLCSEDWELACGTRAFSTLRSKLGLGCGHLELRNPWSCLWPSFVIDLCRIREGKRKQRCFSDGSDWGTPVEWDMPTLNLQYHEINLK